MSSDVFVRNSAPRDFPIINEDPVCFLSSPIIMPVVKMGNLKVKEIS